MSEKRKDKHLKVRRQEKSSLADFIERPVPSEQEVAGFERVVQQEMRDQEIDSNLSEIYRDKDGDLIDVSTLKVKRGPSALRRLFSRLTLLAFIALIAYGAYFFLVDKSNRASLDLNISAPDKVLSGEEFFYDISYHNTGRFALTNVDLSLKYPDNFIFLDSSLPPKESGDAWRLPDLDPGQSYSLSVKGKLINKADAPNVLEANLVYTPSNFSSEFKEQASANVITDDLGFSLDLSYLNSALVGQENEAELLFANFNDPLFINQFFLNISAPANIDIKDVSLLDKESASSTAMKVDKISGTQWQLGGLASDSDPQKLIIKYQVNEKTEDKQTIIIKLEQLTGDGRSLVFFEKNLDLEIMKSDLNLTLSVNGQTSDSPVNFGQTLEYSLDYVNRGSSPLKDVNIRLDLNGSFFDWESLEDSHDGHLSAGGIVWTKDQVPALGEIQPNQAGRIAFSIKVADFKEEDLGRDLKLESQARFNLHLSSDDPSSDRISNTVINKINSDLRFSEKILYFDENNIPVGSGPLPPKVGEKTSFRVYWTLSNRLHELSGAQVSLSLPPYVSFENQESIDAGSLIYDNANHRLVWDVGRLPIAIRRANLSFLISINPLPSDQGKIMILSPGASAEALDIETQGKIIIKEGAKTSKLEDDEIASLNNSGQVQ